MAWAILIACGKGEKFAGDTDTAFLTLASRPVIAYSLAAFEHAPDVEGVVVVAPKERVENVRVLTQMYGFSKVRKVVAGSVQRPASVQAGLKALEANVDIVVLHDASRPLVTHAQVTELIKVARKNGGSVLAQRVVDSVKQVKGAKVKETIPSEDILIATYPQAYKLKPLLKGYTAVAKRKSAPEDDAQVAMAGGADIVAVVTERPVVRISSPSDLAMADLFLRS